MADQALDPAIQVLPGTDVEDLWDRFEVFEALHHSMQICNPMRSSHLDELIDVMALDDGDHVLDVGSGYGELLIRGAQSNEIIGTGIDLSPWMVTAACTEARSRVPDADLTWVLGEAKEFTTAIPPQVCVCIGAEWVWHGLSGTASALARRVAPGGMVVLGAARLHLGADQAKVRSEHGYVDTVDDVAVLLDHNQLDVEHRIDPSDDDWDAYLERTRQAAGEWAQRGSSRAQEWVDEQHDWHLARERDRNIIGWSVWVARKRHNVDG